MGSAEYGCLNPPEDFRIGTFGFCCLLVSIESFFLFTLVIHCGKQILVDVRIATICTSRSGAVGTFVLECAAITASWLFEIATSFLYKDYFSGFGQHLGHKVSTLSTSVLIGELAY